MTARILSRLAILYGPPDSPDPMAWFAEVTRLVAGYSHPEQDRAFDRVTASHRGRMFPSVSEIVTACSDAREAMLPPRQDGPKYPDWTPSAIAKADALMRSGIGRILADDGCAHGLHDFLRKQGRLPTHGEISAIRAETREFDAAYAKCCTGQAGLLSKPLKELGEAMLARRNELAAMANEGGN